MGMYRVILPYGENVVTMAETQESTVADSNVDSIMPDDEEIHENYENAANNLDNIYYNALDEVNNGDVLKGKSAGEFTYGAIYKTYSVVSSAAPYIFVFSLLLCIFICAVARKNKRIRRWAIVWLGICVPVVLIIFVFGIGASPLFASR